MTLSPLSIIMPICTAYTALHDKLKRLVWSQTLRWHWRCCRSEQDVAGTNSPFFLLSYYINLFCNHQTFLACALFFWFCIFFNTCINYWARQNDANFIAKYSAWIKKLNFLKIDVRLLACSCITFGWSSQLLVYRFLFLLVKPIL